MDIIKTLQRSSDNFFQTYGFALYMNALNVYNVRWIPKQTPAKRLRNKTVPVNLPRAPLQSPLLSLLDLPGKHSLVKQDSTVSIETEQQVVFITKYGHGS